MKVIERREWKENIGDIQPDWGWNHVFKISFIEPLLCGK